MENITAFLDNLFTLLGSVSYGLLIAVALCVAGGLVVLFSLACYISPRLRAADKRPVLHFLNAYSAVFFALLLTGRTIERALFYAVVFWFVGYLYYGAVCALTRTGMGAPRRPVNVVSALPEFAPAPVRKVEAPAADGSVRLDHALAIADRLLLKQLARADRQELEKIKTTLTVIQVKGSPSPKEGEIINAQFNALLKLMSKYDY